MAFNQQIKRKIVRDKADQYIPCVMCGARYPLPDAVHIVDEKEWKHRVGSDRQCNGIPLCPNCHRVFDEILRPYLYKALPAFGATGLPNSWKANNKMTVTEQDLGLSDGPSSEPIYSSEPI